MQFWSIRLIACAYKILFCQIRNLKRYYRSKLSSISKSVSIILWNTLVLFRGHQSLDLLAACWFYNQGLKSRSRAMHRPVVSPQSTQQAGSDGVVISSYHFPYLYFMLFLIYYEMIEDELYKDCGNSLFNHGFTIQWVTNHSFCSLHVGSTIKESRWGWRDQLDICSEEWLAQARRDGIPPSNRYTIDYLIPPKVDAEIVIAVPSVLRRILEPFLIKRCL